MTIDGLLEVLNARPFAPFRIWLADGHQVDIQHREQVLDWRGGRTLSIRRVTAASRSDMLIDILLVSAIETTDA